MLLSIVMSFLLAKMFRQKTYVFLSAFSIALISFLSAGLPYLESGVPPYALVGLPRSESGIVIRYPLPLSFPFYAYLSHEYRPDYPSPTQTFIEFYQIEFWKLQFPQVITRTAMYQNFPWTRPPSIVFALQWGDYFLYYTFFLSLNLVGAIIGYWTGRSTLAAKLSEGSIKSTIKRVDVVLNRISLGHLAIFYVFLTAVDIVQTLLGFPEYEVGIIARVFIVLFSDWAWLYFPFRIILTFIIVVLVYRYATPQVSKKLFVVLSLITFASVIWNVYSLAMWSS